MNSGATAAAPKTPITVPANKTTPRLPATAATNPRNAV